MIFFLNTAIKFPKRASSREQSALQWKTIKLLMIAAGADSAGMWLWCRFIQPIPLLPLRDFGTWRVASFLATLIPKDSSTPILKSIFPSPLLNMQTLGCFCVTLWTLLAPDTQLLLNCHGNLHIGVDVNTIEIFYNFLLAENVNGWELWMPADWKCFVIHSWGFSLLKKAVKKYVKFKY